MYANHDEPNRLGGDRTEATASYRVTHGAVSRTEARGVVARPTVRRRRGFVVSLGGTAALLALSFATAGNSPESVHGVLAGLAGAVPVDTDTMIRCAALGLFMTVGASALATCERTPPGGLDDTDAFRCAIERPALAHLGRTEALLRERVPQPAARRTERSAKSADSDHDAGAALPSWLRATTTK